MHHERTHTETIRLLICGLQLLYRTEGIIIYVAGLTIRS